MKDLNNSLIFVFLGGALWMLLARLNFYVQNPSDIHRHDETGKINWKWMLFINFTAIVTGGAISTVVFMAINYFNMFDINLAVFIASVFGIVADKVFIMLQQKLANKAEELSDDY